MIPPDERPEITTPETRTDPETTPDVSTSHPSSIGRFPTALTSVKAWLRSSIDSKKSPSLPQRIPPKMRLAQFGTALTAVGVLSVALGGADGTTGQDVQLAAETASPSQAGQSSPGHAAAADSAGSTAQPESGRSHSKDTSANTPGGMVSSDRSGAKDQDNAEERKSGQRESRQQDNGSQDSESTKGSADQDKQREQNGNEQQNGSAGQGSNQGESEPGEDQIDAWINKASDVLEQHGYPDHQINDDHIRTIILKESGGDPSATNNWDSNAAQGTPSKGLMQTIDPTFESYALPGHGNVWDPVDNIIAATRYSVDRYGSVSSVPGITEMQSGGSYEGY